MRVAGYVERSLCTTDGWDSKAGMQPWFYTWGFGVVKRFLFHFCYVFHCLGDYFFPVLEHCISLFFVTVLCTSWSEANRETGGVGVGGVPLSRRMSLRRWAASAARWSCWIDVCWRTEPLGKMRVAACRPRREELWPLEFKGRSGGVGA
jgi:hypothetical protein